MRAFPGNPDCSAGASSERVYILELDIAAITHERFACEIGKCNLKLSGQLVLSSAQNLWR